MEDHGATGSDPSEGFVNASGGEASHGPGNGSRRPYLGLSWARGKLGLDKSVALELMYRGEPRRVLARPPMRVFTLPAPAEVDITTAMVDHLCREWAEVAREILKRRKGQE